MTSNPPPNGMARAYLCPVTHRVWRWNGGMYGADDYAATAADVHARRGLLTSIPEWSAANWDELPEYVMAPEDSPPGDRYPFCGVFSTGGHDNWGDMHKAQVYSFAVYTRHPDHPEVLRRVWLRDDAPSDVDKSVPISSVDWSAVHAGKVVPPSRVDVPERDMDGSRAADGWDVAMLRYDGGLDFRCFAGLGRVTWAQNIAAHYTINGHLLGHRTADGRWSGWRDVSEKARTVTAAGESPKADRQAGEMPAPTNPGEVGGKLVDGPEPRGEWVDGKWVPNLAVCEPRGCTPQTKATFADEQAGLTHNGVITIMQDLARRRDLFDKLNMAYQTGAEPVAMSPEFFEALERQRGKR